LWKRVARSVEYRVIRAGSYALAASTSSFGNWAIRLISSVSSGVVRRFRSSTVTSLG
jgi:hypothetical protein